MKHQKGGIMHLIYKIIGWIRGYELRFYVDGELHERKFMKYYSPLNMHPGQFVWFKDCIAYKVDNIFVDYKHREVDINIRQYVGITGPTGPTGPTGATGKTLPTGPNMPTGVIEL